MLHQMLVDSHVHLDSYSDNEVRQILDRASEVGVGLVISAGTTISSTERSLYLSSLYPNFFTGVGIHPMDIKEKPSKFEVKKLHELAVSSDKVLVMSEIGLDFMENMPDRSWQYELFRGQIQIARDLELPIVFHSREAHSDCFRVLREERGYEVGGVMHYFQGSLYEAESIIDLGFKISIARPLFRLETLRDVVKKVPLQNIVIETDAAPQPFKKKRENWTEPRHLRSIIGKISELKDQDEKEVEQIILENIIDVLGNRWDTVLKYVPEAQDATVLK